MHVKTLAFAVMVLVSCAPVDAAVATPTPQVIYMTATPAPTSLFDGVFKLFPRRSFTVALVTMSGETPLRLRSILYDQLPVAWNLATRGRSQIQINDSVGNVYMTLLDIPHPTLGGTEVGLDSTPLVLLFPETPVNGRVMVHVAVHELGHALGCCRGVGSDGAGHVDCAKDPSPIMCSDVGGATVFNDYELAQMGLGTP